MVDFLPLFDLQVVMILRNCEGCLLFRDNLGIVQVDIITKITAQVLF